MLKFRFTLLAVCFSFITIAQSTDQLLFNRATQIPIAGSKGETVIELAKNFIGKPYVGQTLEASPEKLVCNLREFDCYTLVENVVALTRLKYKNQRAYNEFQEYLTEMRYRNGFINGYSSRIHYFTEWITQAEKKGIITDKTKEWGRVSNKNINFMSTHPQFYAAMNDIKVRNDIKEMENRLNQNPFYEIKKEDFKSIELQIENGDIIVFTSTIQGLDVNHEGFAIWQNGKLHLIHASLDYKKVIISPEPLSVYLNNVKKHQGIMVLRLN